MECDENSTGFIDRESFIYAMHAKKMRFPRPVINFFLNILVEEPDNSVQNYSEENLELDQIDLSINAILSLKKLKCLFQIFYNCPIFNKGHTNNSANVKTMIRMAGFEDQQERRDVNGESYKTMIQMLLR